MRISSYQVCSQPRLHETLSQNKQSQIQFLYDFSVICTMKELVRNLGEGEMGNGSLVGVVSVLHNKEALEIGHTESANITTFKMVRMQHMKGWG